MNKTIEQWQDIYVDIPIYVDSILFQDLKEAIEDIRELQIKLDRVKNLILNSKYEITYLDQFGIERSCVVENLKE